MFFVGGPVEGMHMGLADDDGSLLQEGTLGEITLARRRATILMHPAHETIVCETAIRYPAGGIIVVLIKNDVGHPVQIVAQQVCMWTLDLPVDIVLLTRKWIVPRPTGSTKKYVQRRTRSSIGEWVAGQVLCLGADVEP
ncbi:hypothetical protein [Amycolatopsis sp. NPDC058986]|uniref:hypothetical protein n=1 Tax=unclassified Amycolatopsis TaxID=2618356 RepID=UPI00366DA633